MANTSNSLQLPAPLTVLAGTRLIYGPDSVQAAAYCHNWLTARGGCAPMVDQGWQGSAWVWNGAAQVGPSWRIPTLTASHTTVDVVVQYTQAVAVGQIRALSATAGGAVAVATVVGGPFEVTLAGLAVASPYDDVSIELTSAGGNLVIHDAYIVPVVLANPLPAAAVDGVSPMGVAALAAEAPLTPRALRDMRVGLPLQRARPRVVMCWSGLDPAVGQETLRTGYRHRTLTRTWQGSVEKGITYNAHAYVRNATAGAQRLIWQVGALGWERADNIVAVAAGFTGWKTATITLRDEALVRGYPWEAVSVGLDMGVGAYPTTCEVLRYTVWGE